MKYTRWLFILFLLQWYCIAYPQAPNRPDLYTVTVDPESGCDIITWLSSVTPSFDDYVIGKVFWPNPLDPPILEIAGTVDSTFTQFTNCNTNSNNEPVGYSVWAIEYNILADPIDDARSGFDPPDSTIFLTADYDSCTATIDLTWSEYSNWQDSIDVYNIYRRTGPNVYVPIGQVSGNTNSYTIINVASNETYEIFVEAVHMDGSRRSTSNRVDIQTSTSAPPVTVIADYATLGDGNTIDLSFTVIGSSGSSQLILTRSNVQNGPFTQIADFNTSDTLIRFTDGVSFTSDYYFYRMEGLNNCLQPSSLSNTASNKSSTISGTVVSLSWNEYQYWLGGVDQYRVIRTSGRNNPVIDTIDVRRNNFYGEDLGVRVNYPDPVSSLICYQIDARELTNIYGTRAMSLSNRICCRLTRYPHAQCIHSTMPMPPTRF
jgi:hypothetical protein